MDLDKDIGVITSIVGDLAFTTVNKFPSRVTLVINITDGDRELLDERQKLFKKRNEELLKTQQIINENKVKLIPIYLESERQEGGEVKRTWKAFPEDEFKVVNNEFIIKVSSWGDQPIGIGTRP